MATGSPLVAINFLLDKETKTEFAEIAQRYDATMTGVIRALMYQFTQMTDAEIEELFENAYKARKVNRRLTARQGG